MTTLIILGSILATVILAWLFRERLAHHLPRKETMTTATLIAAIVLLAFLALLPDILILVSTMKLLPPFFKIFLALSAAVAACLGATTKTGCGMKSCSRHSV